VATARFFLGVDGGQRAAARGCAIRQATSWAHGRGTASNIYIDFEAAMQVVRETIDSAIAPGAAREAIAVGLSLAGLSETRTRSGSLPPCPALRALSLSMTRSRPASRQWPQRWRPDSLPAPVGPASHALKQDINHWRARLRLATTGRPGASAKRPCARRCARSTVSSR